MTITQDAHTSIAEAFASLASGGDTEAINRRDLFDAISQQHQVLSTQVGGGGGASALDDLTDVVLSAPSNGQVLQYNGTNWVNAAVVGGVASVFGRTGAVVAVAGDYDAFYYTEAEVNSFLAGKSDTGHTHTQYMTHQQAMLIKSMGY